MSLSLKTLLIIAMCGLLYLSSPRPLQLTASQPATSVPLPRAPSSAEEMAAGVAKRARELRDRSGYLKNMWYAVALSANVGSKEPVKVQLCGREMVLFRDATSGDVQALDNVCPHRGAPLSSGWLSEKESGTCVVCPYHGWALDGAGALKDVPVSGGGL